MTAAKTGRSDVWTIPNLISLVRVAFVAPLVFAILNGHSVFAFLLFTIVVTSDLLDGFVARRTDQASRFGTLVDHSADAFFVVSITGFGAFVGVLPTALPLLIATAFMQYVIDSHVLTGASLRPSRTGRWNGIAYFVVTGCFIFVQNFEPRSELTIALNVFGWVLVVTTIVSIVERAVFRVLARRK